MTKIENPVSGRIDEYIKLIRVLCECYDQGNDIVSLSIATAIRVLVHDTKNSTSLLTHLGMKQTNYMTTNYQSENEKVHLGLVRRINVGVTDGVGGSAKYWPLCDNRYFPSPTEFRFLNFEQWWNEEVFKNNSFSLTRGNLVLSVTNKDGGAHFDREVEERYDEFRKTWSGGSSLVGSKSGCVRGYDNIPTYPAIRQIAYELLNSEITKV